MSLIEKITGTIKIEDKLLLVLLDLEKSDEEIVESMAEAGLLNFGKSPTDENKEIQ